VIRTALAWLLVVPVAAWLVLRFALPQESSRVVALVSFTPYAAAGSALALILALALRRRLPAALIAVGVGILAVTLAPRVIGDGSEARADASGGAGLTVLTHNTRLGNVDARRLAALARRERVDVVSLQELTPELVDRLEGLGFRRRYPHRVLRARPGAEGTGLFSRFPLREGRHPAAPGHAMTTAAATVRGVGGVEIVSVHPVAPRGPAETEVWRRGLEALPAAGGRRAPLRILAGDFNATLDHAELRELLATGYRDAAEVAGAALIPTWPDERRRLPPLLTIDHVLVGERLEVGEVQIRSVRGSDHRAVIARIARP
jgi:endonuclease/exonuclease/phosphatase (EEP) superfamily protein YafD